MLTDLLQLAMGAVCVAGSYNFMIDTKSSLSDGQASQEALTQEEKRKVWIFALLNPIFAFIILYYGWRKQLPLKAKGVNNIAIISFLIWVIILNV